MAEGLCNINLVTKYECNRVNGKSEVYIRRRTFVNANPRKELPSYYMALDKNRAEINYYKNAPFPFSNFFKPNRIAGTYNNASFDVVLIDILGVIRRIDTRLSGDDKDVKSLESILGPAALSTNPE